ncbi:MAG: hypothetical protein JXB49_30035 [Bacteroidales bacterium]|nr:hypothetical protein [Bacteroidales bacterium]
MKKNYVFRKDYLCKDGEKDFLKFYFMSDGIEAGYRLLFYYFRNRNTYPVTDFIARYAESDINYCDFLVRKLGSDVILKREILSLGKYIVHFENGMSLPDNWMNEGYYSAIKRGI